MAYETTDADAARVRSEVRRFKEHVLVYIALLALVVLANLVVGGIWYANFWLFWIAVAWGIIIVLEGVRLFGDDIGRDWEDRMVSHVMARRRGESPPPPPRSAGARPQPSPPPRPPSPTWPSYSSARGPGPIVTPAPAEKPASEPEIIPPEPQAGGPLVTPPPGHDPLLEPPREQNN